MKRATINIADIIIYSFVYLLISILLSKLRERSTHGIPCTSTAASILDIIAGIAGKLVIPGMIITDKHFFQAVKDLGKALKNIPEIAAYEIGIGPLTTLATFLSVGISILLAMTLGIYAGLFLFALLFITILVLTKLVDQIYYTLLYITLIEKRKIKGLKLYH